LIVREDSQKSENVYIRFGMCLPNNMFIISIRHWKESRPSSRISGLLSCCHIVWPLMTHRHQLMWRRLGITVTLCAEGCELKIKFERALVCGRTCATECRILYLWRYWRLNEFFVLTILVHLCWTFFRAGKKINKSCAELSKVRQYSCSIII